jgi:sigma-E factor negative regulatory protein RseC
LKYIVLRKVFAFKEDYQMIEIAKVVSVNKNIAKVHIMSEGSCGTGCASCKGCSVVTPTHVDVENKIGAKAGQVVKIERNSNAYLKSMVLVFILPVVMMFIGVGFGYGLSDLLDFNLSKDFFGITIGITFLVLSFLIIRFLDKKFKFAKSAEFKIIDLVQQ